MLDKSDKHLQILKKKLSNCSVHKKHL